MLGSARAEALSYSAVKLFSKYSNLCENHTSTSQTDKQTDGQTIYCGITALCVASRGKMAVTSTEGYVSTRRGKKTPLLLSRPNFRTVPFDKNFRYY